MDERIAAELTEGFAMDLWETVRAAKGAKGERVFRHTMYAEGEDMVFAGLFPKKDLLEFPDLDDGFRSQLKVFNLLGVVTDGKSSMDMFFLGGANKPFTSLNSPGELQKVLEIEPLMAFLHLYFKARGFSFDIREMDYESFMRAVEREALAGTPLAEMAKLQDLFGA